MSLSRVMSQAPWPYCRKLPRVDRPQWREKVTASAKGIDTVTVRLAHRPRHRRNDEGHGENLPEDGAPGHGGGGNGEASLTPNRSHPQDNTNSTTRINSKISGDNNSNNYARRLRRIKLEEELPPPDPLGPPQMLFTTTAAKRFHDFVEASAERWSRPYVPDFSDWDGLDDLESARQPPKRGKCRRKLPSAAEEESDTVAAVGAGELKEAARTNEAHP